MSEIAQVRFPSEGDQLAGHLVSPDRTTSSPVGVIISHGFPSEVGGGANSAVTFPELAERIAGVLGWFALTYDNRGCGDSGGDFSLAGWLADQRSAVDHLVLQTRVLHVFSIGFGTGGALAICSAATDERVRGVAALAAPADFDDWARDPRRLLAHARTTGAISTPGFPPDVEQWGEELKSIRAWIRASDVPPAALLVMHGSEDDLVPVLDARVIADAHGSADLRIIEGAGHHLRHDPRAMAVLIGWLDRQSAKLLA